MFLLLALGTFVTSFQVGMADPQWPTRPWHLADVDRQAAGFGYLVEHSHRLAGFVVGGAVSLLTLAIWWTEPRKSLRWAGLVAIVGLLTAFGQLHGTLMAQQASFKETGVASAPDWTMAAGPTVVLLAVVLLLSAGSALSSRAGGVRLLAVLLLVGVMAQGILGGLRVYLNALVGQELATIHGIFSQVVMACSVVLVVLTAPMRDVPADDRWHPDSGLIRIGVLTVAVVFGQIVAGAILRHTASTLGPRLHLLIAFVVVAATIVLSRRSRGSPTVVRGLTFVAASLTGMQILLGIEAWMVRFKAGFVLATFQPITAAEAIVRSLHALVGYGLFATTVALAVVLLRNRATTVKTSPARRLPASVEAFA
jgi:heme A synthase